MNFSEVKIFQVKPDKIEDFNKLISEILPSQKAQIGCVDIKYFKRFFTFDG